jgi:hypothetical protein
MTALALQPHSCHQCTRTVGAILKGRCMAKEVRGNGKTDLTLWILFGGTAIAILCMAGVLLLYLSRIKRSEELPFELAKALLQVGVVALAGAFISFVAGEYTRQRERQRQEAESRRERHRKEAENRDQFRRAMLQQLIDAYGAAKKARRILRAKRDVLIYDEQMMLISQVHLDLQTIEEQIDAAPYAFSNPDELTHHISEMTDYLRKLFYEHQDHFAQLTSDPPERTLDRLPRLADFVGPSEGSKFRKKFRGGYKHVLRAIRGDILSHYSSTVADESDA